MRPFTRRDQILAALFPFCLGFGVSGILNLLVLGAANSWFLIVQVTAFVMIFPCLRARGYGHRRNREIDRISHQRGWHAAEVQLHIFTEEEVEELELINGYDFAQALREIGAVRRDAV